MEDGEHPGLLREELGIDKIACARGSYQEPRAYPENNWDLLVQLRPHKGKAGGIICRLSDCNQMPLRCPRSGRRRGTQITKDCENCPGVTREEPHAPQRLTSQAFRLPFLHAASNQEAAA